MKFSISLPILALVLFLLGVSFSPSASVSRKKRNVAQLGYLVDAYTSYRAGALLQHGNWCGIGGDRSHDGSFVDACDACCKVHDLCYDDLLKLTESVSLNELIANNLQVFTSSQSNRIQFPQQSRRCVPYLDVYKVAKGSSPGCPSVGGLCSQRACSCDVAFVNCLRRASSCGI